MPGKDIFLSYASADRERIGPLVRVLESTGWDVFWDREIPTGRTWPEVLEEEITSCRSVVVVWSETSVKSSWVREEANEGKKRRILFPVRIDPVDPPFGYRELQAADLVGWNGGAASAPTLQGFVEDLGAVLGRPRSKPGNGGSLRAERARERGETAPGGAREGGLGRAGENRGREVKRPPFFASARLVGPAPYLFWGTLTLWSYTVTRLVRVLKEHGETRGLELRQILGGLPASDTSEALEELGRRALPPPYRFAPVSVWVAGFIALSLVLGEYLVDTRGTHFYGILVVIFLADAVLFAGSTLSFLSSVFFWVREHELHELKAMRLALDPGQTVHLPFLEDQDRFWNEKQSHLVLLCIVSFALFLVPALCTEQFRLADAGKLGILDTNDLSLLLRIGIGVVLAAGTVFQVWGTSFLISLVNGHFQRERALLQLLERR